MKVKIYVEGGGEANALRTRCRQGFSSFFERAGFRGRMPAVTACGSRNDTYDSFCTAVAIAGTNDFPLMLVDSEAAVNHAPWIHLNQRDGWNRPSKATDDQAHLMVQCMEAWFLADRDQLMRFFGQGFTTNPLPSNPNVEEVAKAVMFQALKTATRQCRTKGEYDKGKHSFELLAGLDPARVRAASVHADRLIQIVDARSGS